MEHLPNFISVLFILVTIVTVFIFYKATKNSLVTLVSLLVWLIVQAIVSIGGFYTFTDRIPPRFLLLVLPPLLLIMILFSTGKGRKYIDHLNLMHLTLLHTVRIPVEIVLYLLFLNKVVPELMTFEGRNYDIISGLTAPVIFYFGFIKKKINRNLLLLWNFICLLLLINVVVIAILSAPFFFQKFAFTQPNIAILYFPFTWLPACVVPLVLLSHLTSIRRLLKMEIINKDKIGAID